MQNVNSKVGGTKKLTARRNNSPKRYKISSIKVTEEAYNKGSSKYDKFPKVLITRQNGVVFDPQQYKRFKTMQLPCSNFAKTIVQNNKIPEHTVTEGDKCNSNRVDMVQWVAWYDESLLVKNGSFITLKDHPNCYVLRNGIFNIDTLELSVPFVALQKYLGFNILQTYYLCDAFLKHADLDAVREYTNLVYGVSEMPQFAPDSLNYIIEDNILGVKKIGLATLFSILYDHFHISKDVILEMVERGLLIVDSKYNVCFLGFDADGNVSSVYKVSRYKHKDEFSINLYVTKENVGFVYCSEEAECNGWFNSVTVFGSPMEMLCYISLARESDPLVPPLDDGGCNVALIDGKVYFPNEWLDKHYEVYKLNVALNFNRGHHYNTKAIIREAEKLDVPYINELRNLVADYSNKAILKHGRTEYQVDGWHGLINLYLDNLNASFVPLRAYEIKHYA